MYSENMLVLYFVTFWASTALFLYSVQTSFKSAAWVSFALICLSAAAAVKTWQKLPRGDV